MELLQETSLKEKLPRNQIETIAKSVLLKRNFPLPNLQVNNVLHHCASEFFSLLVAEIMDISKEKDVTNESVVNALKNLGFPQYIEGVQTSIEQANLLAKEKKERISKKKKKFTAEELEEMKRQQNLLFQNAKLKST